MYDRVKKTSTMTLHSTSKDSFNYFANCSPNIINNITLNCKALLDTASQKSFILLLVVLILVVSTNIITLQTFMLELTSVLVLYRKNPLGMNSFNTIYNLWLTISSNSTTDLLFSIILQSKIHLYCAVCLGYESPNRLLIRSCLTMR